MTDKTLEIIGFDPNALNATTTSGIIRELAQRGLSRGQIVKELKNRGVQTKHGTEIRYQHVRNVLIKELKRQA